MAEAGLSLGFSDFTQAVGEFMGLAADSDDWSTGDEAKVERFVQAGYRRFLRPPSIPWRGATLVHAWSFLYPTATVALLEGDADIDCPDDFGGLEGNMVYDSDENQSPGNIEKRPVGQVETLIQSSADSPGPPVYVAVRAKAGTGTTGQRFEFLFWPISDTDRTAHYRYVALEGQLSTSAPYPIGGQPHAETILAFCLAIAELRTRDGKGAMWDDAMEQLASSVAYDLEHHTPDTVGLNLDVGTAIARLRHPPVIATVEGNYTP